MSDTPSAPEASALPDAPAPGERLAAARPCPETVDLLARRRSTAPTVMSEPGPDEDQLKTLLRIAARVPDHGKLTPWRFIIFDGEARESFGGLLQKVASTLPDADKRDPEQERTRFMRAPVVIAVVSTVLENHKIPEWEQILSAGAACQTLLIAANAMGFAGQWITEWCAYNPHIRDAMGLRSGERVAGFIYLGTASEEPVERLRPEAHVMRWKG